MQTNRINGSNLIDIVQGSHPSLGLIPVDIHPGSPNHHLEAGVVKFGYYGLIDPNPGEFLLAVNFLTQFLQDQLTKGHMGIEVLTDSHEAIWLRAMLGLRLFQIRLANKYKYSNPTDHTWNQAALTALTLQWFTHHASLLSLGYVPSGPLAGCILLPCARKRGAAKDEDKSILAGVGSVGHKGGGQAGRSGSGSGSGGGRKGHGQAKGQANLETASTEALGASTDPSELTRDIWYGEATGIGPTRSTGASFWTLDKARQDTASGPLNRLVEKEGGDWVLPRPLPKLISPLEVVRYTNGHIARFPAHPSLEDGVTYCKVEYSTGRFTFIEGEKEEGMELGREVSRNTTT